MLAFEIKHFENLAGNDFLLIFHWLCKIKFLFSKPVSQIAVFINFFTLNFGKSSIKMKRKLKVTWQRIFIL